jgi:hypothetical protein
MFDQNFVQNYFFTKLEVEGSIVFRTTFLKKIMFQKRIILAFLKFRTTLF